MKLSLEKSHTNPCVCLCFIFICSYGQKLILFVWGNRHFQLLSLSWSISLWLIILATTFISVPMLADLNGSLLCALYSNLKLIAIIFNVFQACFQFVSVFLLAWRGGLCVSLYLKCALLQLWGWGNPALESLAACCSPLVAHCWTFYPPFQHFFQQFTVSIQNHHC